MSGDAVPNWTFLTNHALVLVCIAEDPGVRLREIGERVGITERAAHRIVVELAAAGYITRQRNGRRNRYTINARLPVHDPIAREQNVGQLLGILTAPYQSPGHDRGTDTAITLASRPRIANMAADSGGDGRRRPTLGSSSKLWSSAAASDKGGCSLSCNQA